MSKRTLLVVGNGLNIDLREYLPSTLSRFDTRCPLAWDVPTPEKESEPLLANLPILSQILSESKASNPSLTDFQHLEKMFRKYPDHLKLRVEVQHFLVIAFSHYQMQINRVNLLTWKWATYLRGNQQDIVAAVSFNYDLLLERAFTISGMRYFTFDISDVHAGIPLIKPHGSIDFTSTAIAAKAGYPINIWASHNDFPQRRLRPDELLRPRIDAEIVPPTQRSHTEKYQWVAPGYDFIESLSAQIERCVVIGISYWEVDRPEIDRLLASLGKGTTIEIANPHPQKLIDAAAKFGLHAVPWTGQ